MPWLEVPEWRAWESYAAPMSDTSPDTPAPLPGDGLVITGTIDIRLEGGDEMAPPAPASAHVELDQLPETPEADVIPFPDGAAPAEDAVEDVPAADPEPELAPGQRFPVEITPERIEDPRFVGSAPVDAPTQGPVADPEAYARKITTSRSERLRGG